MGMTNNFNSGLVNVMLGDEVLPLPLGTSVDDLKWLCNDYWGKAELRVCRIVSSSNSGGGNGGG